MKINTKNYDSFKLRHTKKMLNASIMLAFLLVIVVVQPVSAQYDFSQDIATNVYLVQNDVLLNKSIYGDAFLVGDKVQIDGLVEKDLSVFTSNFILTGTVGDDLRVFSSSAKISGYVFSESMIFASDVELTNSSAFGGPVKIYANTVIIDGLIKNDVKVSAERIVLNGIIEKNAEFDASEIVFGPDAKILGNLVSTKTINSSAVYGSTSKLEKEKNNVFMSKLSSFLMLFIVCIVVVFVAKKFSDKATDAVQKRSFFTFISGLGIIILTPLVALFLIMTLIGIPLAILLFAVYALVIITGCVYGVFYVGKGILSLINKKSRSVLLGIFLGVFVLTLLSFIPSIFGIVLLILIAFGTGGFALAIFNKHKKKK